MLLRTSMLLSIHNVGKTKRTSRKKLTEDKEDEEKAAEAKVS